MNKMDVSKEEFMSYERVRKSGITNMFHITKVELLSGLDRETILEIMRKYSELKDKYIGEKNAPDTNNIK